MFDHDAVLGTLHPPGGVEEEHLDAPERHEKPGTLRQAVVPWRAPQAARAPAAPAVMGLQSHFDAVRPASLGAKLNVAINETGEMLNPVQNGLNFELDSWAPV